MKMMLARADPIGDDNVLGGCRILRGAEGDGISMTIEAEARQSTAFPFRLGLCVLLVILADHLFWGHDVGWTAGLFCFAMLLASALANPAALKSRHGAILFGLCLALCAGLVETDNLMTFLLFWVFFAALFTQMRLDEAPSIWLRKAFGLGFNAAGGAALVDSLTAHHDREREGTGGLLPSLIRSWLLPIAVSVVFLSLFADANPVIGRWIAQLEWRVLTQLLAPERAIFWMVAAIAIWGLLRAGRVRVTERTSVLPGDRPRSRLLGYLFSREAVLRSLLLANAIFLAQNAMDAGFLWAGAALPEGLTYAQYAHRSAHPLIATALLAAAFVLVAMREAGGLKGDRLIRGLIYLWLAQNLVLVMSAIWRTLLYVSEYSLTYMRLAALLWMGLVLVGLLLIVVRLVRDLSSSWLIKANIFAALALLVATCPIDMGRLIADFNVAHFGANGWNRRMDLNYLRRIGPSAIPALKLLERQPGWQTHTPVGVLAGELLDQLQKEQGDWRRWTFRNHRLSRELALGQSPP